MPVEAEYLSVKDPLLAPNMGVLSARFAIMAYASFDA
ncbi:hypothetical protein EM595_p1098 (plasmid) [Duffyella gerundensis]|jgi:hypothetical protein|uniref:Uncharacterized protein n=1 Tax=Duffyella gerundensis TaxID=1619313 RepID=A0A0U5LAI5_9GAMM|nr:hypothetical protein EM595_p1098 [Duffyella gerundensis]